jgi:site-specific DNA-methyltransferase (adenine-specific)
MSYNSNIQDMDLTKLSKTALLAKCEELQIKKYKSKNKTDLIKLIENKIVNKNNVITNNAITNNIITNNAIMNNAITNEVMIKQETKSNPVKLVIEEAIKNEIIIKQELELNKIYNEDCVAGMAKIKDESADIIICDPPYNIGKDFGNDSDKQKMDDYLIWCDSWIRECLRILKPQGTLYIYGFSEILAFIRTRIICNVRWLVWHYTNKVTPSLNFWQRTHESILCCYKDKPIFNRDDVREPYTETFLKNAAGKVRKPTVGRFSNGDKETIYSAHEGGALPRDVIKVPALAGGAGKKERVDHPTQKPLNLCDTLIKASLNKCSHTLLVVPFVGSGSECVSAKKNNVNFIGFEINNDYVNIANERLYDNIKDNDNNDNDNDNDNDNI